MIIDEIARRYRIPPAFMSYFEIKIMGNYIDKNSDILYVAANYKINDFEGDYYTEYIGLFAWPIYEDKVKLKLLWYKKADSKLLCYKPLKLQYPTIYEKSMPNILKLDLKNRDTKSIDLYLAYDVYTHIFIDMKSNRSSARMEKIYNNFVSSNDLISKFDNLLFIDYGKINEYSLLDILGEMCFIVSDVAMIVKEFHFYYL
jgi:hypothetical protein